MLLTIVLLFLPAVLLAVLFTVTLTPVNRSRITTIAGRLFTAGIGYLTAYAAVGRANFGYIGGPALFSATWAAAAAVATAASLSFLLYRRAPLFRVSPGWMLAPFLLLLFSDVVDRRFVFFMGPEVRYTVVYLGFGAFILSTLAVRSAGSRADRIFCVPLLLILQLLISAAYLKYSWGKIIFSDDHPSFVYRLLVLREQLPSIPFYNTAWNGGYVATEFFATGALGLFLMAAPVLCLLSPPWTTDVMRLYTLMIPYLFVFVVPLSLYAACRLMRMSRSAAVICALVGIAPSLSCPEWALKYGTLPFALSVGLFPLVLALVYRLFVDTRSAGMLIAVLAVPVTAVGLGWPMACLFYIPFAVLALLHLRGALRRRDALVYSVLCLIFIGPWFYIFATRGPVVSVLSRNTLPGVHADHKWEISTAPLPHAKTERPAAAKKQRKSWSSAVASFQESVVRINPLIWLFGIVGFSRLRDRRWAKLIGVSILYLSALAIVGPQIKPQLELKRMIIPATFLLCVPAAAALEAALRRLGAAYSRPKRMWRAAAGSASILLFGAVLLAPVYGGAYLVNRSVERYSFAPDYFPGLVEAIKKHGGEGRTVFLGFILHDLGPSAVEGGHIAPLASLTGRQLYASSPYHSRWSAADPIPEVYRKRGREGIEEFLDLINTTSVVAFQQPWIAYCERNSEYQEVFRGGNFRLYTRRAEAASYVQRGRADVEISLSSLTVRPGTDDTVVRFRYFPRLMVEPKEAAELYPVRAFDEDVGGGKTEQYDFIGIRVRNPGSRPELKISLGY